MNKYRQPEDLGDGLGHYKRLIDDFVEIAKITVIANRIRENGHSERTNDADLALDAEELERKSLFLALTKEQKETIAKMLEVERVSAVHDIAAQREGLTTSAGLDFVWNGKVLPDSPFASMHYDFICRYESDPWPDAKN